MSVSSWIVDLAELEGRLGRGDVDDHDLIELVRSREGAQVGLDAFDGGAGGVVCWASGRSARRGDGGARC